MANRRSLIMGIMAAGFALLAAGGSTGLSLAAARSLGVAAGHGPLGTSPGNLVSSSQTATIRVRCERRGAQRSKISVDGNNLAAGSYRARVTSGTNSATSGPKAAVSGEVEFDFDSNPNDVAAGAKRISAGFIQGNRVKGEIRNAAGGVIVAATVACAVR